MFTLSDSSFITQRVQARDLSSMKDLFWCNVYTNELGHQQLVDGPNSVDLERDGIYVLSVVAKDQPGMVNEGFIGIGSAGLQSLPIGVNASDLIDLGTIDPLTYGSSASLSVVSAMLGFDPDLLLTLRGYDLTFKKFLNPDVNRNGVYDYEEGISWLLDGFSVQNIDATTYDLGSDVYSLTTSDLMNPSFTYVFHLYAGIPATMDTSLVTLQLPNDVSIMDAYGPITHLTDPRYNGPEIMAGHYPQYYFATDSIVTPAPPISGDFVLDLDGTSYLMDDLEFPRPEDDYEGYLFPLFEYTRNALGVFKDISWQWKSIKNGEIRDAIADEVKIKARTMSIYLGEAPQNFRPEYFGISYWENAAIDVEYLGYIRSDSDYGSTSLRATYWTRASNNEGLLYHDSRYTVPDGVDSQFREVADDYDGILGIWENPVLYSSPYHNGRLVLYKYGMGVGYPSSNDPLDSGYFAFQVVGMITDPDGTGPDLYHVLLTTADGTILSAAIRRVGGADGDTLELSYVVGTEAPSYFAVGEAAAAYGLVREVAH